MWGSFTRVEGGSGGGLPHLQHSHHRVLAVLAHGVHRHARRLGDGDELVRHAEHLDRASEHGRLVPVDQVSDAHAGLERCLELELGQLLAGCSRPAPGLLPLDAQAAGVEGARVVLLGEHGELLREELHQVEAVPALLDEALEVKVVGLDLGRKGHGGRCACMYETWHCMHAWEAASLPLTSLRLSTMT
jgi:hypothetical protein